MALNQTCTNNCTSILVLLKSFEVVNSLLNLFFAIFNIPPLASQLECCDKDLHSGVFGGSVHEAMTDLISLMGECTEGGHLSIITILKQYQTLCQHIVDDCGLEHIQNIFFCLWASFIHSNLFLNPTYTVCGTVH